ncbi:MAG TPA: hypothetical protein PLH23_17585 [Hyphomonadaceae bacterium]|jgi:ElaB/YqjD/DUF883 family membrane-anchored ribosome-binding protein|nr:hypothetical protein [Hyphomonadaceae bacterium]HPI50088.1 hypothetical protein [Hyphomonadaceae bacterium]
MTTARKTETNGSASALAGRVAEEMSDFSEKARRVFGESASHARELAEDVADQAVRGGKKAAKFVTREVKEHPLRTLAIGAAVGAVVAAVIMLRNRED